MFWLISLLIVSLIFCAIGWTLYFQERKKYLLTHIIISELQKLSFDWQQKNMILEESTEVWKKAAQVWKKTAELHQHSANLWKDLYLQTEESSDEEEFIN
jgi:cell division protein FtsL